MVETVRPQFFVTCFFMAPFDVLQVSTKTTVVNFSVKQLGLEAQLLGIVVQREQPSLEEQSSELTVKVSTGASKSTSCRCRVLHMG